MEATLKGRWGGRGSERAGARDMALDQVIEDATSPEEKIARVRALYERPGTPGEKAAAAEALRRLGADPDRPSSSAWSRPQLQGRWNITVVIKGTNRVILTANLGGNLSESEARARALEKARQHWQATSNKRVPEMVVSEARNY
jgi:hypothetical protein